MTKHKGLELDDDLRAQKKLWKFQKVGRTFWGIIVLLGLGGLFGFGPLSKTVAKDSDDIIEVEYQRFAHIDSPDIIEFKLGQGAAIGGRVHLWIDSHFLGENPVQKFSPEPVASRLEDDRTVFEFSADDNLSLSRIVLETETQKPGMRTAAMGLVGGPELEFWKFFWP
jgi:hypothetical protein